MSDPAAASQPMLGSAKPKAREPPGRRKALAKIAFPTESSKDVLDVGRAGAASQGALLSPEPGEDEGTLLHASSPAGRHLAASQDASSEQRWVAPAEDVWCYIASSPEAHCVQGSRQPSRRAGDASKAALPICSIQKVSVAHLKGIPVIAAKKHGAHRLWASSSCVCAPWQSHSQVDSTPSWCLTARHIPAG